MTDELFSVEDQVVLVSGGSRGIGRAIAEGFAERGATVVITGRKLDTIRQTAEEIRGDDRRIVHGKACDVADTASVRQLVDSVATEFGRIDTLINCAGVNNRKKVEDYTEDDYDFITNINIRGAFFMAQAVGRKMIAAGQGSIVNVDSLNTHRPLNRVSVYAMSKAAMSQMTRSMAMEWGPLGVRVNAVAPGFTLTDISRTLWQQCPELDTWREQNTPLRRIGQPEDMLGTCLFLATRASSFMTGQVLYVDGGTSCGLFWPIPID